MLTCLVDTSVIEGKAANLSKSRFVHETFVYEKFVYETLSSDRAEAIHIALRYRSKMLITLCC